jgi:hypothetical protein
MSDKKTKSRQVLKTEQREEKPILSREDIVEKMKKIFRNHIGRDNAITKAKLFKLVFGEPSLYDPYELWFQWDRMRKAMNWLRRTTKYFVVSKIDDEHPSIWLYFVVKDDIDAEYYKNMLTNTKKKINYMMARCDKAVEEKFYLDIEKGHE